MVRDHIQDVPADKPALGWIPRRDARVVTCWLDVQAAGSSELCFLPHWNPSAAVIERYDAPMRALLRYAEIAKRLRENGWIVIDHIAADRVGVAA